MSWKHPPGPKTAARPSALPNDAASATNPKVLRQEILQQVAALEEKVSNTLKKRQAKYKWYFNNKVRMIPMFAVEKHVYVHRPPPALLKEDKKTSPQNNKLLSQAKGPSTVMYVKSYVININENGILNTISLDEAKPVPTKSHVPKKKIRTLYPPAQTTVLKNKKSGSIEPLKYVVEKVVHHRHTLKNLLYNVRWYEYSAEENTWQPSGDIRGHFVNR